ncbi:MAG: hypothetical protein KGY40_02150 [Thioalkalivibrio sp.]|nr:hypothetical protein [Thioalkalivibrio sp.]
MHDPPLNVQATPSRRARNGFEVLHRARLQFGYRVHGTRSARVGEGPGTITRTLANPVLERLSGLLHSPALAPWERDPSARPPDPVTRVEPGAL